MRAQRDEEFATFVRHRRGELLRTATLLAAGDRHLAEDLVQTSLTRVYLGWGRLAVPEARYAYARRALVTCLIDETRRPWRRREQSHAELPDRAAGPAGADADDRLALLGPALAELPARMRAAVVLRYLHELSVAETADALSCSQGTVKSQTSRGLEHLRRSLGVRLDEDPGQLPPTPHRTAPSTSWSLS